MYRIGLILGPAIFFAAVVEWVLRLTHYVELIQKTLPWTEHSISPSGIWITMVVGVLIFLAALAERQKEKESPASQNNGKPPRISVASIRDIQQTANPHIEIHNYPQQSQAVPSPDEIAEAVSKKLKDESIFVPTDGFIQLEAEGSELEIPAIELKAGQTIRFKYFYANRGARPVYDVQSWGLMQVLDPSKNSANHL